MSDVLKFIILLEKVRKVYYWTFLAMLHLWHPQKVIMLVILWPLLSLPIMVLS